MIDPVIRKKILKGLKKAIKNSLPHRIKAWKGKGNPGYIDGRSKIKHICIELGCKTIVSGERRRCSKHSNSGKYNSNWRGGISGLAYGNNFTPTLKAEIRKRDNYTCQICGISQKKYLKNSNRRLDIHHIDYDKLNNNEDNLISLCQSCHMKTNYNRLHWMQIIGRKLLD